MTHSTRSVLVRSKFGLFRLTQTYSAVRSDWITTRCVCIERATQLQNLVA